jgi:hypothetical protein
VIEFNKRAIRCSYKGVPIYADSVIDPSDDCSLIVNTGEGRRTVPYPGIINCGELLAMKRGVNVQRG